MTKSDTFFLFLHRAKNIDSKKCILEISRYEFLIKTKIYPLKVKGRFQAQRVVGTGGVRRGLWGAFSWRAPSIFAS